MKFVSSLASLFVAVLAVLAAASPANAQSKLAFSRGGGALSSQICLINSDGSGQTCVTGAGYTDGNPSWAPDGSQIVFESSRYGGTTNIFRMYADGNGLVALTDSLYPLGNSNPTWSPDGTRIAFGSNRDGKAELWLMNADGTNLIKLTTAVQIGTNANGPFYSQDFSPAWSPDGTKIAFSSNRNSPSDHEIYLIGANGTNLTQLTNNDAEDRDPAWSPDGSHLVFSSTNGGRNGVYSIDITGAGDHQITSDGFQPAWSPDGQKLIVTALDPQNNFAFALYVMNSDGSSRSKITSNGTTNSQAATWQPTGGPAPPPPPPPPTYTVKGRVVEDLGSASPPGVPGTKITLSGSASGEMITDANGSFQFDGLPENGDFTLTATNSNWSIFPASRTFNTRPPLVGFVGRSLDVAFDAAAIFLQFISATYDGTEGAAATITVIRAGAITGTSTIDYSASDGTATAGADFAPTSGTLRFNPGDQLKTFSIPIIYDKKVEPAETINLKLQNPTGSITRGRQDAVLTIRDPPPRLATEADPTRAIAFNATNWVRDPFSLTTTQLSGQTGPTRVALFAQFIDLLPSEDFSAVTVTALDSHQGTYQLPVEFVGKTAELDWLSQINVTLPGTIPSGDLWITITLRGTQTNTARIRIQ
jgi:TolB protein